MKPRGKGLFKGNLLEGSADVRTALTWPVEVLKRDGGRGDAGVLVCLGCPGGEADFDRGVLHRMSSLKVGEHLVNELVSGGRACTGDLGD